MTDILLLRQNVRNSQVALNAQQTILSNIEAQLSDINEIPPAQQVAFRQKILAEATAQRTVIATAQRLLDVDTAAYQAGVLADPMQPADPGLPLVLLPVRIETAYLPTAAGKDLVVRVYPDDIHVDTHEPELTAAELTAGTAYWNAVWGAGPNQARLDAAWTAILGQLKPTRAAWAVRALLPAVPRPADETPVDQVQPEPPLANAGSRPGTFNRPARTALLPDMWRIIGLRSDNTELFYAEGSAIPETLDLSFGPPSMGTPDSDLPFHPGSLWLVDLDAAIAAGMAVRIPLTGPDFSVAQLFVLGTSASVAPDDATARLESALIAHQYTNGLGFLPPGTPTNNTEQTRSAWQSAPTIPAPSDLDAARANYQAGGKQNAAVAAAALGVDGTEALSVAPNGLADQHSDIATVQQFLWPALAGKALSWLYTTWDTPANGVPTDGNWVPHIDSPFVQALQAHAGGWVRSRGALPVIRAGNQPYGLLPALSLDDWATDPADAAAPLITWLRTLRSYWSASVGSSSYVLPGPDPNADSTVANILKRLPLSTDIEVRADADPVFDAVGNLAVAPIPELPTNSELFLAVPAASAITLPIDVVDDGPGDQRVLLSYQQLFHDSIAVLEQTMAKEEFLQEYPGLAASMLDPGGSSRITLPSPNVFPGSPAPDFFISLVLDAFVDPLNPIPAKGFDSLASYFVYAAVQFDPANAIQKQQIQQLLPEVTAFTAQFDLLCAVSPNDYETTVRETLDVFSHRLDAWITSLAARRLEEMRAAKPSGLVLGGYGWVENLTPRSAVSDQVYVHAPSMNHAATAAVLRAGYDSHGNAGPLAVNLVSSRVRNADWLAAGVRSGQTVGALLGYRFERGLHDASLDNLIALLRTKHPLPLPTGPDADANGQAALEAIAARNVVDGLYLSKNKAGVLAELALAGKALTDVTGLLDDLANVLDAFGDLLLAESVHHLVGGNPLRAGLTADTAGRGEPVPDRFDVTLTPRSGRALTWQLGALLPADFRSPASGWQTDRPRAAAEPHVDAWAAGILGNADSWLMVCSLTTAAGDSSNNITLDALGLCALDVVAESAGDPCQLELRIAEAVSGGLPAGAGVSVSRAANPDGTPGFGELLSLAARMRTVLGSATALGPQQLQGADTSPVAGINVGDLDARATALGASLNTAVQGLQGAAEPLDTASIQALRSALIALADHGLPAAWPAGGIDSDPSNVALLTAQAASLLAAAQALTAQVQPAAPDANASSTDVAAWLAAVTEYVHGIIGGGIPVLPAYVLAPDSPYAAAFGADAAPVGGDPSAVMVWLRRIARVRDNSAALHDLLLGAEALQASPASLTVAQIPAASGAAWAGLPFPGAAPPTARLALVFSAPAPIDPAASFCGFVCDTWTEQLPGVTSVAAGDRGYEASEVTGVAFKVDTPAAMAPQAVLLAVAPDPSLKWSLDILFDTVKETLELAKIRPVDLGDLVRFFRVLPAILSSSNVDKTLTDAGVRQ